jgi:hypothetical protein
MAFLNLVYRDQLFPREAYRRTFEELLRQLTERQACQIMVNLLAMAHDRGCERELAACLEEGLEAGRLPDMDALSVRFAPAVESLPNVVVRFEPLKGYETLLGAAPWITTSPAGEMA